MRMLSVLLLLGLLSACASTADPSTASLDSVARITPLEVRVSLTDVADEQALKEFGRDLAARLEDKYFFTNEGGHVLVFRPSARKFVPLHSIPSWVAERNLGLLGVEVVAFGRLVRASGEGIVGVQVAVSLPGSGQRIPLMQGASGDQARYYLELAASLRSSSRDVSVRGMLVPTGDGAAITVEEYRFESN